MSVNPYESPRVGDPPGKQTFGESDSIRQLLTEIRDQQAELLQLQRAAMQRQQSWGRYAILFMIVPLLFAAMPIYRLWTMPPRPNIPRPARTAPLVAPQPTPTASLVQPE